MKRPLLELAAMVLTATLHLAWPLTALPRTVLVVPLVLGWVGYFVWRSKVEPGSLAALGLRAEGFWPTFRVCGLLMLVSVPLMVGFGLMQGAVVPWYAWFTLLLYPVWGVIQQVLVQGLVTNNLVKFVPPALAVGVSSILFGAIHMREPVLVVLTGLLGLVFGALYLRFRNVWPLGITHGWLGMFVYYFVLMKDPLTGAF